MNCTRMYEIILNYDQIAVNKSAEAKFHVCLYFDAMFDFNFPFRPLLAYISDCLQRNGVSTEVKLPAYMEFEDFVTGEFIVGGRQIGIYFEHSLSYVSFSSNSYADLEQIVAASAGKRFQHAGYGLDDAKLS